MDDKDKREKLHKILDLVLDINGFSARNEKRDPGKPTSFFYFHGHTAGVYVNVFADGYADKKQGTFVDSLYLDVENANKKLTELIRELENLKDELVSL